MKQAKCERMHTSTYESNVINAAKGWFRTYKTFNEVGALRGRSKDLYEMVHRLVEAEQREKAYANEYVVIRFTVSSCDPVAWKRRDMATTVFKYEVLWNVGATTAKKALKAYAQVVADKIVAISRQPPRVDTKRLAKRGRPRKPAAEGSWPE